VLFTPLAETPQTPRSDLARPWQRFLRTTSLVSASQRHERSRIIGRRAQDILRREKIETTILTLIDLFTAAKQKEGKAKSTVSWYKKRLSRFAEFVGEGARLPDLTLNAARSFVASLQEKTTRYEEHPVAPQKEGGLSA